jgi:hypothetical protein
MAQRCYLRAAGHKYNMRRGRGKPKTGRDGKKLWLPYVPHGMKWNKSSKSHVLFVMTLEICKIFVLTRAV